MFTLMCFLVGVVSIVLGGILPPDYTKLMSSIAINSFGMGFLVFVVRAFLPKTVKVVIVDDRTKR